MKTKAGLLAVLLCASCMQPDGEYQPDIKSSREVSAVGIAPPPDCVNTQTHVEWADCMGVSYR